MNPEDYERLPTNNMVAYMSAGAIAGVMEHCIMYPLDSVKTRMQSLHSTRSQGISETFLRMVRHEGIFRPVRGMSIMVLSAGPSHAIYFSSYEFFKSKMLPKVSNTHLHSFVFGAAGGISTLLHDAIMNPAEVIKQRIQMENSPYKSVLDCMARTYRAEGLRAFYRSFVTQLAMNVPFQSVHFAVYEFCQRLTNPDGSYRPPAHVVSGAAAGAVAAAVTTPLDVCKTLLNTQEGTKTKGLAQAVNIVYRLGGVAGFFKGVQARIMYTMPSTAICWSTYEFFKYMLGAKDVRFAASVHAEEPPLMPEKKDAKLQEMRNVKPPAPAPKELPSMSGAGLYGSVAFNTMHTAGDMKKDSILNVTHT